MSNRRPGGFRKLVCGLFVSLSGMAWIATAGLAAEAIPAEAAITGVGPQTTIGLGDAIVVSVAGLKGPGAGKAAFPYQNLILYLDGHPLPDHKPARSGPADCSAHEDAVRAARRTTPTKEDTPTKEEERLSQAETSLARCRDTVEPHYVLTRKDSDEKTKKAWIALLGAPKGSEKPIAVGVGLASGETVRTGPGANSQVTFEVFSEWRLGTAIVIFVGALVVFLGFAYRSRIIRDVAAPKLPEGSLPPFSLGRTQMAWWFFLVLGAYLFISVITGDYETISAQSLILLGIAIGTGMGAMAIDFDKTGKAQESLDAVERELAGLDGRSAALTVEQARLSPVQATSAEQAARLLVLAVEMAEIPAKRAVLEGKRDAAERVLEGPKTQSFAKDLVMDRRGVSFHRFQIVVWTVVLGFVFVTEVYQSLAVPEFSATLLSLMGITGGTYLGFKFPEQKI